MSELTPVEQKEIEFYGDELTAVRADNGQVYASIRHMCQALGIDPQGQTQRIDRHTVLSKGRGVCNLHTPGGLQPTAVLRVDLVPLWLAGIRASSVNDTARAKLERFQEQAAAVLWEAFQDGRLTADPSFSELLEQDTPEAQAYKMIRAMLQLAESQLLMKGQLEDHEQRLEDIERQLGSGAAVSSSQAMQISQAVKAVAFAMGGHGKHYQAIYGEMYRKFDITSYKLLPAARFDEAMAWLTEWHANLTGEEPF